jgi:hypothetical protein
MRRKCSEIATWAPIRSFGEQQQARDALEAGVLSGAAPAVAAPREQYEVTSIKGLFNTLL